MIKNQSVYNNQTKKPADTGGFLICIVGHSAEQGNPCLAQENDLPGAAETATAADLQEVDTRSVQAIRGVPAIPGKVVLTRLVGGIAQGAHQLAQHIVNPNADIGGVTELEAQGGFRGIEGIRSGAS